GGGARSVRWRAGGRSGDRRRAAARAASVPIAAIVFVPFRKKSLDTRNELRIIIRNGTKNNGDGTWIYISPHSPVRWPPALRSMRLALRHILSRSTRKPNAPATAPTIGRSTR